MLTSEFQRLSMPGLTVPRQVKKGLTALSHRESSRERDAEPYGTFWNRVRTTLVKMRCNAVVVVALGWLLAGCGAEAVVHHGPSPDIHAISGATMITGTPAFGQVVHVPVGTRIVVVLSSDGSAPFLSGESPTAPGHVLVSDPSIATISEVCGSTPCALATWRAVATGSARLVSTEPCSGTACTAAMRWSATVIVP
jgi:hypothetical protein